MIKKIYVHTNYLLDFYNMLGIRPQGKEMKSLGTCFSAFNTEMKRQKTTIQNMRKNRHKHGT